MMFDTGTSGGYFNARVEVEREFEPFSTINPT